MKKELVGFFFCTSCVMGVAAMAHQGVQKNVKGPRVDALSMAQLVFGVVKADDRDGANKPDGDDIFPKQPPVAPKPIYQDPDDIEPYREI